MKYTPIIGSSDKKFRTYDYGKRTGKKLVKYSPTKAKISKFRASMKNMKLSKGIYKGVKFAAKTATSPISLGLTAGFLGVKGLQKLGERKGLTFPKEKSFKKSIYRQQYDGRR
jgi:hypothetical protein|tara:strand:- start:88 stop:426 length:339 start_codon:yes stop_codon:yes gene_type:complete